MPKVLIYESGTWHYASKVKFWTFNSILLPATSDLRLKADMAAMQSATERRLSVLEELPKSEGK